MCFRNKEKNNLKFMTKTFYFFLTTMYYLYNPIIHPKKKTKSTLYRDGMLLTNFTHFSAVDSN